MTTNAFEKLQTIFKLRNLLLRLAHKQFNIYINLKRHDIYKSVFVYKKPNNDSGDKL